MPHLSETLRYLLKRDMRLSFKNRDHDAKIVFGRPRHYPEYFILHGGRQSLWSLDREQPVVRLTQFVHKLLVDEVVLVGRSESLLARHLHLSDICRKLEKYPVGHEEEDHPKVQRVESGAETLSIGRNILTEVKIVGDVPAVYQCSLGAGGVFLEDEGDPMPQI